MTEINTDPRSPHLDDRRTVWDDDYSGEYLPIDYDQQFDRQWQLFLSNTKGFTRLAGVETADSFVDDRIYELTGVEGLIERKKFGSIGYSIKRGLSRGKRRRRKSLLRLQPSFPIDFFRGKRCLDVGCGAGRWTKALLALGGKVKSTDTSEGSLRSVRQFHNDVEELDLFSIPSRADLEQGFDFSICWGVLMHLHDPKAAFEAVARTVAPGGTLYTMTYAPEGMHNTHEVWEQRRKYHRELSTAQERLEYAFELSASSGNVLGHLDMLNTFYNWVIPESVIHNWYRLQGFTDIVTLNNHQSPKCAYHVAARRDVAAATQLNAA